MKIRSLRRPGAKGKAAPPRRFGLAVPAVLGILALVATACGSTIRPVPEARLTASLSSYMRVNMYAGPYPSQTASLNAFSPDWVDLDFWVNEPLAIAKPPTFASYIPEIATSWKLGPSSVTIHLRPNAHWQNGSPVTSTDVADTFLVDGIDAGPIWSEITGFTTPNAHTIVLHVKSGIQPGLALYNALNIFPVPASIYKQFITPGLEKTLLENAAGNAAAAKTVAADLKKLENFNPHTFIGDGPFQFQKMTTQEVLLKKWKGFWAAKNIHIPGASFVQLNTNNAVWAAFHGQQLDYAPVGSTYQAAQLMRSTPGGHVPEINDYNNFTLYFNDHDYPYTLAPVRQAIAYLVDRVRVAGLVDAHSPDTLYPPTAYPTGEPTAVYKSFMTKAQIHALNPYHRDPAKATALLKRAGFHKRGGTWYMGNGKPFRASIQTRQGENDIIAFTLAIANELSSFGLKTTSIALGDATQSGNEEKGDFQMSANAPAGETPLSEFDYDLSTINFSATGRGIGYGPVETVPGLGKINIPKTLAKESATISPSSKEMAKLVRIWVDYVNKEIPYLTVTERNVALPYSTARYTDWPKLSNPLWALAGANLAAGVPTMMEHGYIRPKS